MSGNFHWIPERHYGGKRSKCNRLIQILKSFEITELPGDVSFRDLPEHILYVFIVLLRNEHCCFIINVFIPALLQTLIKMKNRISLDLDQSVVLNIEEVLDFDTYIPDTYFLGQS